MEYRPLACCTVIYKLISKVLAGRLQRVVASIITETQTGLYPWKDNVVFSVCVSEDLYKEQCILQVLDKGWYSKGLWYCELGILASNYWVFELPRKIH